MKTLYPEIGPFDSGMLKVSDIHDIYWERVGNPDGIPVVFLHGGPGGGLIPMYRQFFDPAKFHVVLFDQRGSGGSTPHASLEENTTWDLIKDIEALRKKFGIDKWHVFGGSWGSTLRLIRSLNPRPGSLVTDAEPQYVEPDVFVSKRGDSWRVELNPEATPRLRVNADYAALMRSRATAWTTSSSRTTCRRRAGSSRA